jgi:DNA segregation ATPase FtsK/SpoIIIE-like protein|tara:strand:+ start:109 stop:525 length:417 start_codon:yes stop_codon:yes gene_type:complete
MEKTNNTTTKTTASQQPGTLGLVGHASPRRKRRPVKNDDGTTAIPVQREKNQSPVKEQSEPPAKRAKHEATTSSHVSAPPVNASTNKKTQTKQDETPIKRLKILQTHLAELQKVESEVAFLKRSIKEKEENLEKSIKR